MTLITEAIRMKTRTGTYLLFALVLAALSSAKPPDTTVSEVEEKKTALNESYGISDLRNKEHTPTSHITFHTDTATSIQGTELVLDEVAAQSSTEDNSTTEILLKESLLPATIHTVIQAESSESYKKAISTNMVKRDQMLTNSVVILSEWGKHNPTSTALNVDTDSHLQMEQLKGQDSKDKYTEKKIKIVPTILETKSKRRKGKKKNLAKKKITTEKENIRNKYMYAKKDKHNKQKKEPKKKDDTPYFEDHYCPPECACYGRVVQCSDKGISKIPYGAPFNTRYLLLMNNKIDFMQLDLLSEYLSLEFLVLNNNRLTDGAVEGAFEGVPKLTRLFIDENNLSSVPSDLPPSLLELRINDNNISHISDRAISTCTSLRILSLERNAITDQSISSGAFYALKNLQIIRLNSNQLETVPSNITVSLKELFLEENKITVIPNDVFSAPSELTCMHLNNNQLTNKGIKKKAFWNLAKLETLNMAHNLLKGVPKHLPPSLRKLILNGNHIPTIEKDAFFKLSNLTQILLSGNKIIRIAAGAFKGLSSLDHLDISNNRLLEVPRRLPLTLRTLFLFNNYIRIIPVDSFCGKLNVESRLMLVRLENNKISHSNVDSYALRCLRGYQVVHFY